jgi:transcriptional regulator with GAF, ATPase, and Fis domain
MAVEEKIDIDVFKVVFRAMAQSDNLEIMANHMAQLLVATQVLASFGMSMGYVHKGPVLSKKSIVATLKGNPIVVQDVNNTNLLQYPEDAIKEGIGAIVSIPILFFGEVVGALRLYHHEIWDISEKDVDSLLVLAENIGLAMAYTRVLKALKTIRYTTDNIRGLWMLEPE